MYPVGVANTRISTDRVQNILDHCCHVYIKQMLLWPNFHEFGRLGDKSIA